MWGGKGRGREGGKEREREDGNGHLIKNLAYGTFHFLKDQLRELVPAKKNKNRLQLDTHNRTQTDRLRLVGRQVKERHPLLRGDSVGLCGGE